MAFLDDLRKKWHSGAMTPDEVLAEVLRWEDDIAVRTDQELDEAWTFRQEIESASSSGGPAPENTSPPLDGDEATDNGNKASFTSTHGQADPWAAVQQLMAEGRWEAARQVAATIPDYHPRFNEVPSLLEAITEGAIYDQVPGLSAIPGVLASSRARRNWNEFDSSRTEAFWRLAEASANTGKQLQMPRSIIAILDDALKAQEAEKLVETAIKQRMAGDLDGAAVSLGRAAELDPRYARVWEEQKLVEELRDALRRLSAMPGTPISPSDEASPH
jgi:hypothetical protein